VQDSTPLTTADTADLLQLAVNCSSLATAATAAMRLPATLKPATAQRLLVTALVRQHDLTAKRLMKQPAVQGHLDAPTLEVILRLLMCWTQHDAEVVEGVVGFVHEQVPAAQVLDKRLVYDLLQAAMDKFGVFADDIMSSLCRLPAARQLTSAGAVQLLKAAMKRNNRCIMDVLCRLPAAQQLGCGDVLQLLQASLENENVNASTCHICGLPAAQQLSSDEVLQLLRRAVAVHTKDSVFALTEVAAAYTLTRGVVEELMHDATASGAHGCIGPLQRLLWSLGSA
jgi:hypothetical protein